MDFEFLDIHIHLTFAGSSLSRVDVAIYAAQVLVASLSVEFLVRSWKLSDLVKLLPDSPALFKPDLPLLDDKPSTEPSVKLLSPSNCDKFADLLLQVQEGLAEFPPVPCDEGVNGTYFLKNKKGKYIAVFKPEDEEIFSPHNPKSGAEQEDRMKSLVGLLPGEASRREVAAFLVDREGFFGVPKTAMASITHPLFNGTKTGSMQEFVESDGPSWDVGPSAFPVREVHKIGILDLYLFNFDRHGGNILLNEEEGLLIPIDNGFSLPDTVAVPNLWFEWMNWSQAKKPFDEDTRAFIDNLDVNRDLAMLKEELGIRDECLRVMRLSALLLKKGAGAGLTLFELGRLVCRLDPDTPSPLEDIYQRAVVNCANRAIEEVCEAEVTALVSKKTQV